MSYLFINLYVLANNGAIGLNKSGYQVNIFLISLRCGASNEYPQHMFSWRNKKNINTFRLKKILSRALAVICHEVAPLDTVH